jgi:deoxyribodipyrimidine photo-lyase
VKFTVGGGTLINDPENVLKKDGTPYTVFTPYFRNASQSPIETPQPLSKGTFCTARFPFEIDQEYLQRITPATSRSLLQHGGRSEAVIIIKTIRSFSSYGVQRDFPSDEMTTGLSPHLKFGTISVREAGHAVHSAFGADHPLTRQLYWRDFFAQIACHFPHVFGHAFREKYDAVQWDNDDRLFGAWCEGRTGFPIVDAGMRQLNETGFMHGRARMICASFLIKDLHIDWRLGEKYFARRLTDYDPAVNNGNWQWCASTGCDAQPYFRIFNPWLQQRRFDPDARYVKRYIPQLSNLSAKEILTFEKKGSLVAGYPSPVIDHKKESKISIARFAAHR